MATEEDIEQIVNTTKYYYKSFDCSYGFLLGYTTKEKLYNNLNSFYVIKEDNLYAGHVRISFGTPPEFGELSFYNQEIKNKIMEEKAIYIEHIVIDAPHVGKGLGGKLFDYLYEKHPDYHFMSSVVVQPYKNNCSLHFHRKNGFVDVAYYYNDVIGNKRYESIYLLREKCI